MPSARTYRMDPPASPRGPRARGGAGFSFIELLIAGAVIALAVTAGVAHVTRGVRHADWTRDRVFARDRALSILAEIRTHVSGSTRAVAADLDEFDDGGRTVASLTIMRPPDDPTAFLPPGHPVSGNVQDTGTWRWWRRVTVRPITGQIARDLRLATVEIFRRRPGEPEPGERMAEVSSMIRTLGDAYPATQVYDLYLLALENVPGWWVNMDAIQPFLEATLQDLETRNPGLSFRVHWITRSGFGRDPEYAPYTNEARTSTDDIPWTYAYPGRLPAGLAAERYYVPGRMGGRLNLDGVPVPAFRGGYALPETFTDLDGDGEWEAGEPFVDADGDARWSPGNPAPYAMADQFNHCLRAPEEEALYAQRVAAKTEDAEAPTWRLLLDRMIADPARYHNAIIVNLHGELLPMPPVRNYSDAASVPALRAGWRAVTHPERLRFARVAGSDALSQAPRYRVYAYKTAFTNTETVTTQAEPFVDADKDGAYDAGEAFTDWNGNGVRDDALPITLTVEGGDFTAAPNAATDPSVRVLRLPGGVDADGVAGVDEYADWNAAPRYPETFADGNGDGIRQVAEPFLDLDGDALHDGDEPWQELDGDGAWSAATEVLADQNGNGRLDRDVPAEPYTDANGNGRWDAVEPWWDLDGNGSWTPPTAPVLPRAAWDPAAKGNGVAQAAYLAAFGEPFLDLDGDGNWDAAEGFTDGNGNGVRDGGFRRGEMWFRARYDAVANRTILELHGTPLETNRTASGRGLPTGWRLYDLDYVPCPTPATAAGSDRFERDLYDTGNVPKNTSRWTIELPLASVRQAFASAPGAGDGDAADRVLEVTTRFGTDLASGTLWPARNAPTNLSRAFAWFHASPDTIPFSERYQFQGDPRHGPYADLDAQGTTSPHGYNWYFDSLRTSGDARAYWLAFDSNRLAAGWLGRTDLDVPRYMSWLRRAIVGSEAVYTTLTGFSYYYLSVGADVGWDASNGFTNSIPMSGLPFGRSGSVNENTIATNGTSGLAGAQKLVVENPATNAAIRSGGSWWAKPWLGELCPDSAYAAQWAAWGNLRASTGAVAGEFRLVSRSLVPSLQQPTGTRLQTSIARLNAEGCTSLFNVGSSSSSTFHHQYRDGTTGSLVDDGPQLAANYNLAVPTPAPISRPFGLTLSTDGGVGPEFSYTSEFPRHSASVVRRFYGHSTGLVGSGLVRLQQPGGARGGYVVVNGLDRTIESGSAFIARYSLVSLVHSYFAAGLPGGANRVKQLPRVEILSPSLTTEIVNPGTIAIRWRTTWARWDGGRYTAAYPADFTEDATDLVFVPLYSSDDGRTWRHMRDDSPAEPGVLPLAAGGGPDPAKTLTGTDTIQTYDWPTPSGTVPAGYYRIRMEAFRRSEQRHYAQHMEKIYVDR